MGTALPPTPPQKSQTADVMWRACVAEFISCFMFVFVSTGANLSSGALYAGMTAARLLLIALASGFSYTFIMYSATQISGGVMNPAILLACVLTGNIGIVSSIFYFVSQLIGYIMGAAMLKSMVPEKYHADLGSQQLGHGMNFGQGVMMEFMLTATLTFVYFSTAIDPRRKTPHHPLALGFVILCSTMVALPFTGASLNPGRTLGIAMVSGEFSDHGVYWTGPILGALCSGLLYQCVYIGWGSNDDE